MLILWSIIPSLINKPMDGNQLHHLLMIYLIGAYMRKYQEELKSSIIIYGLRISILLLVVYAIAGQFYSWTDSGILFLTSPFYLLSRSSFVTIFIAISLVYTFARKNYKIKIINYLANGTFGVYLIHDNPYIRPLLWNWLNNKSEPFMPNWSIPYALLCTITIFIICSIIDNCLTSTINRLIIPTIKRFFSKNSGKN